MSRKNSPLQLVSSLGQSVWIDNLSRESNRGGHLKELMDEDSVVGATSNPSIFEKAMTTGEAYDEQLGQLDHKLDVRQVFWTLAEQDIRDACELFHPVWEQGGGRDGYVSLEVDPDLAYDTLATFRRRFRRSWRHDSMDSRQPIGRSSRVQRSSASHSRCPRSRR